MQAVEKSLDSPNFADVVELARDDMDAVDRLISTSLESDVALVSQVSQYIVTSGGKRLRLNDDQCRPLAAKGRKLGLSGLRELVTMVTPETIMRYALSGELH